MAGLNADLLKPGLKALYYSGAHRLLAPFAEGVGLIFMLHRVSPDVPSGFAPNRGLTVTPAYLDAVIGEVRNAGMDIVSLDEAHERLISGQTGKRFTCFTLDDGYRDNKDHAWPTFRRHGVPFTIYVPSDYPDGTGELWWVALERVIASTRELVCPWATGADPISCDSDREKQDAFDRIYGYLRHLDQDAQRRHIKSLCSIYGVDMQAICRELIMGWDDIREMSADPLVTIGAHTVAHYAVSQLPEDRAREEMKRGADILQKKLGIWPSHLSYPYGDAGSAGPRDFAIAAELGFKTAVTTRKGVLFPEHTDHLTALPRVSLNGDYQESIYTKLFMSGAPFVLWNRFRKVNAA